MAGIEGSNELNDRQRFRGFYRTDATGEFIGPAVAELARQFNWTKMAIISHSGSLFSMVCVITSLSHEFSTFIMCIHYYVDQRKFGFHIQG